MRLSKAFLPTLKEVPSDAVVTSHKLMLRAGLIRPLMAGVYNYLPFGQKAALKAIQIVREEMDRIGGQEVFLPMLNPVEIWQETGRASDFGSEMFHLRDRKDRELVLAPTHEEIICSIARNEVRSYKELPQIWYQFQSKFRDEPRPRSGELRTRQFIMKDSYSLDSDSEGLDKSYDLHDEAYRRIFKRCGLDYFVVGASSGLMGGSGSEEFMIASDAGEDTCAVCDSCDYAANLEVASSALKEETTDEKVIPFEKVPTPGKRTVEEVSQFLGLTPDRFIKSLVFVGDDGLVMVLIRGDEEVNESKLLPLLGASMRPAEADEVLKLIGAEIGYLGPVGLEGKIRIIADNRLKDAKNRATGANENDHHVIGVQVGETFKPDEWADIRTVKEGEPCSNCGEPLNVVQAIELGHIFKLGTKYSKAMKATVLDKDGKDVPLVMGSYGIGIGRLLAAAIENQADNNGIIWSVALAPYEVVIVQLKSKNPEVGDTADKWYENLKEKGWSVALDDRDVRPGFKFKDADLLGYPFQIVVSERNLTEGNLELKRRRDGLKIVIPEEEAFEQLLKWREEDIALTTPD
ncbi:MAG: proline--tRNA ligase [Candidatus Electryonea clarkiae]|nr:proline--tRNA ligase [Candidatus Electryonea clarkiae]MDP8289028.1 proline--tRNA ligase [Candidatus Electryonea clarkiae]